MRLNGALNLSRIPKNLIRENSKGEKILYVNVNENYRPGQYGDTHTITCYDKENNRNVYLANLKPVEPKQGDTPSEAPRQAAQNGSDDLPF